MCPPTCFIYFVCAQVDGLEKKWNTWSFDVEENKRLVLDEVADVGATPQRMSVWGGSGSPRGGGGGTRARRRTAWGEYLVKASPVYFGWIVAGLVAVCALIVSPAQVYCVGVVVDFMAIDLSLSRLELSTVYATAALLSAPLITLHPLVLKRISRRLLISLCGGGVIGGILLVAAASGRVTLLLAWTLLLAVGPGMLYPAAESVLLDWWHAKRARVQCGVQAAAALLGMIILPALLAAGVGGGCSGCSVSNLEPCGCWRGAYSALGASLALPVAVIAALFLEGGAADHDLHLDDMGAREDRSGLLGGGAGGGGGGGDGVEMAAVPEPSDAPPADAAEANGEQQQQHTPPMAQRTNGRRRRSNRLLTPRELWALHDVLTHTTFWLAQVSVSTVQALVAAFLFHRTHIAATHFDPNASGTTPPEAGLVELVVGLLTAVCSPLNLIIRRKEYLVLIAMSLACLGMFILASSSGVGALNLAALLLGMAFGVTNAYATTLWEYFYGDSDAHRIKQISVAIATGAHTHIAKQITASKHACTYIHTPQALLLVCMRLSMRTASSGVAIWLFAIASSRGSYHSALVGGGLLALVLAALDVTALAKPEVLESVVRRAPTWEQLVAFRQRKAYFSNTRRAKQNAARLAGKLRAKTTGGGPEADERWVDATMEPTHLANPIERNLAIDPEL